MFGAAMGSRVTSRSEAQASSPLRPGFLLGFEERFSATCAFFACFASFLLARLSCFEILAGFGGLFRFACFSCFGCFFSFFCFVCFCLGNVGPPFRRQMVIRLPIERGRGRAVLVCRYRQ